MLCWVSAVVLHTTNMSVLSVLKTAACNGIEATKIDTFVMLLGVKIMHFTSHCMLAHSEGRLADTERLACLQ